MFEICWVFRPSYPLGLVGGEGGGGEKASPRSQKKPALLSNLYLQCPRHTNCLRSRLWSTVYVQWCGMIKCLLVIGEKHWDHTCDHSSGLVICLYFKFSSLFHSSDRLNWIKAVAVNFIWSNLLDRRMGLIWLKDESIEWKTDLLTD